MNYPYIIHIRVSPEQRNTIIREAIRKKQTISTAARNVLVRGFDSRATEQAA